MHLVFIPYKSSFETSSHTDTTLEQVFLEVKKNLQHNRVMYIDIKEEITQCCESKNTSNVITNILGEKSFRYESLYFRKDYHPNILGVSVFSALVGSKIIPVIPQIKPE